MAGQWHTASDAITETLANLGVLSAGQPVDPEDYAYVNSRLDPTIRLLVGLEVVNIADSNNIPGVFFSPFCDILAGECAEKFGVEDSLAARLIAKGLGVPPGSGAAAQALKLITRLRPTGEVLFTEYL